MMSRRKFQITLLLAFGLLAGNALAQSLVPIDLGSVSDGHVYLLEDASDASPAGNTGNIIGAPQVVDGLSGKAMQFNGTGDGVHVPDSAFINTAVHQNQTVIAVFNCADVTKTEKQVVFEEGGTTRGLNIYVHEGLVYAGGWNPADYTPQWSPGTFISAPIGSNEWHVVTAVLRGGGAGQEDDKFEMWMDGKLIGKGPGAQLNARSDDNGIAHVIGQSKFHDGNATAGGWYFEGLIDELWILDHALTESELAAIAPNKTGAKNPVPDNGTDDVLRDSPLSWTPGKYAVKHHLYFGDSFEDVNAATAPLAVLDANTYDPGRMEFGKTYYWRVDEVNASPDNTVFKGDVWNFQAEPYSIAIPVDVNRVTASSSIDINPPSMTVNGSGFDGTSHGIDTDTMWLSASPDLDPWLMVEFDGIEKLDQMLIWNANSPSEGFIGWGIKDVTIEYSVDGVEWTVLAESTQIARAPGLPGYDTPQAIDFGSVPAKYVRLNIQNNWGGILMQYGVSEVQFYGVPVFARTPVPVDGAANIRPDAIATWRAGREAGQHTISVSQDPNAIVDGSAVSASTSTNSVDLGSFDLEMGATYYWKVDEVNEAEVPSLWAGPVWSFGTVASLIVDDFESYGNLSPNRPFQTWHDGYGYSADEYFPEYAGNGTGAAIGHDIWGPGSPYFGGSLMETGSTIPGSTKSMPFYYTNTGGVASQTERNFAAAQDWTVGGAKTLSISFSGKAGNTGTLFVMINNAKITYPGNAGNISHDTWQAWNIDLSSVNTNLQNVTKLTIGVDGSNASGLVLIDDIRLFAKAGEILTPVAPASGALVGAWSFNEGSGTVAADSSGHGYNGTIVNGTWEAGPVGSALHFDGASSQVNIPAAAWSTINQQVTVSLWTYVDSSVTQSPVTFAAYQDPAVGNTRVINAHIVWSNSNLYFDTGGDTTGYDRINKLAPASVYGDSWVHWAFTKNADTGEQKVYRNGTLWLSGTGLVRTMTGVTTFTLGAHNNTSFWNGSMDEFQLYNKELTQEEILWLAGVKAPIDKPF